MPDAALTAADLLELVGPRSHVLALLLFALLNLLPGLRMLAEGRTREGSAFLAASLFVLEMGVAVRIAVLQALGFAWRPRLAAAAYDEAQRIVTAPLVHAGNPDSDTGTEAAYLGVRLPNGRIVMSSALTNA